VADQFEIDGDFIGINVARYSLTSSLAISVAGVGEFIKQALDSKLRQLHSNMVSI
jgi:hypothetical protein